MAGTEPKNIRKKRVMRRIQEYKKFRGNCQRLRRFIKEKHQLKESEEIKILTLVGRSKSEGALLIKIKNDRQMGRICVSSPNLSQNLTLQESIYLWRLKRDRQHSHSQSSTELGPNQNFVVFPFLFPFINIGKKRKISCSVVFLQFMSITSIC